MVAPEVVAEARRLASSELRQHAQDTHSHVADDLGRCRPDLGDRCDITAALRLLAARIESA